MRRLYTLLISAVLATACTANNPEHALTETHVTDSVTSAGAPACEAPPLYCPQGTRPLRTYTDLQTGEVFTSTYVTRLHPDFNALMYERCVYDVNAPEAGGEGFAYTYAGAGGPLAQADYSSPAEQFRYTCPPGARFASVVERVRPVAGFTCYAPLDGTAVDCGAGF